MTFYILVYVVWLAVFILTQVEASPIWRCPDVKLLPCKTIPKQCTSFRMIYIRHVHLECPACLICADPWELKPWSTNKVPPKSRNKRKDNSSGAVESSPEEEVTADTSDTTPSSRDERRRLRKERRERKEKRRKRRRERKLRRQRQRLSRKKTNLTDSE